MDKYISKSFAKGLNILFLLMKQDGLSLSEIANKTNINKSTSFRLLHTLQEFGIICKYDNKYYMTCAYNLLKPDNKILDWSVIPYIQPLVKEFNLSAYIGIPVDHNILYSQIIPRKDHLEDYDLLGEKRPLNTNAMGKCVLAFLDPFDQKEIIGKINIEKKTSKSITNTRELLVNLQVIKNRGFAIDDEETQIGRRCVGVPIIVKNECIATFGMSGNTQELKYSSIKKLANKMKKTSEIISNRLFS